MPKSQPMYRKISSTPAGVPFTVEPAGSASGCVLIEKVTQDGQPVVFFRLYVGKGIGGSGTAKA